MNKSRLELKRTTQLWLLLMPKLKSGRWAQPRKCQLWQIKPAYIQMRSGSMNFPHFSLPQKWLLLLFFCFYVVLPVWNCLRLWGGSEEKVKYLFLCQAQPTILLSKETIKKQTFVLFFNIVLACVFIWNSACNNLYKNTWAFNLFKIYI